MGDFVDQVGKLASSVILMAIAIGVLLLFAVIAIGAFMLGMAILKKGNEEVTKTIESGQTRREMFYEDWFNAPMEAAWKETLDMWLYKLEDITGGDFTTTPGRLWMGVFIIFVGAFTLAAVPFLAFFPFATVLIMTAGVVVAVIAGSQYVQLSSAMFPTGGERRLQARLEEIKRIAREQDGPPPGGVNMGDRV